jgi:precorrin-6Y C5,15-methyltransferase (decarboxylating)
VIEVVGIGEDGWDGLPPAHARVLADADVVVGSPRQLALVEGHVRATEAWPTPFDVRVVARHERVAVVASGDPMFHGVGATLVRAYGRDRVRVHPAPSSVSLAAARLGWPLADVTVVSAVARPLDALTAALAPGRRVFVLTTGDATEVAELLCRRGFGGSTMHVLARLGGPHETITTGTAEAWPRTPHDPLAIVAIACAGSGRSPVAGLPDDAYDSDGVMTKREVRAVTLAALAPLPGELLWDVGSGSGSVAIEWMRSDPSCRAIAVEPRADRCARIETNARALGVPGLSVVVGAAPAALDGLERPDAVFVGGGLTEAVLSALITTGARIVANAVTLETAALLAQAFAEHGGSLTRIGVEHAEPLGGMTAYRPAITVTQWTLAR